MKRVETHTSLNKENIYIKDDNHNHFNNAAFTEAKSRVATSQSTGFG